MGSGQTAITVRRDGREAIERLSIMLAVKHGRRFSLNDSIIEAEKIVRSALSKDESANTASESS